MLNIFFKSVLLLFVITQFACQKEKAVPADKPKNAAETPTNEPDLPSTAPVITNRSLKHISVEQRASNKDMAYFLVYFIQNDQRLSHEEFLDAMSKNEPFAEEAMRELASVIRAQKIDSCGFVLGGAENTPFFLMIQGKPSPSCKDTSILPGQAYSPNHQFKNILSGNEHAGDRKDSTHAIAFNSASMTGGRKKRLVIPKGLYVTIYDFAEKASQEEISDFFSLVKSEVERLFTGPNISFSYEVHTGSDYFQTVPHFHLRLYEKN